MVIETIVVCAVRGDLDVPTDKLELRPASWGSAVDKTLHVWTHFDLITDPSVTPFVQHIRCLQWSTDRCVADAKFVMCHVPRIVAAVKSNVSQPNEAHKFLERTTK